MSCFNVLSWHLFKDTEVNEKPSSV